MASMTDFDSDMSHSTIR